MQKLTRFAVERLSWRGRASRKSFYASVGLFYLIGLLTLPLGLLWAASPTIRPLRWVLGAPGLAVGAGVMAFLLCATIRRLHDRNKSGWWLLAFFGPHVVLTSALWHIPQTQQQLMVVGVIVGFLFGAPFLAWGMIEIFILRGVKGGNRYGPDPLKNSSLQTEPLQFHELA